MTPTGHPVKFQLAVYSEPTTLCRLRRGTEEAARAATVPHRPYLTLVYWRASPGAKYLKKWRGCGGSIKPISIERDAFGEEQLLKALSLIEGRLHPQVCGAR
jgi:hypothetical protein